MTQRTLQEWNALFAAALLAANSAHAAQFAPLTGVQQITAGGSHNCVLSSSGALLCWGSNSLGQLGIGSYLASGSPLAVSTLSGSLSIAGITATYSDSCALTTAHGIKCWGSNLSGQLGNNDAGVSTAASPVSVVSVSNAPISGIAALAVGGTAYHACAVTTSGGVKCWGDNYYGQLGNFNVTAASSATPVDVVVNGYYGSSAISGITAVAVGLLHTCALGIDGQVLCWGANSFGQLGYVSESSGNSMPTRVFLGDTPLGGIKAIVAGNYHSCALSSSGSAFCWGDNSVGQIGSNTVVTPIAVPTAVRRADNSPLANIASLAAGGGHTCALINHLGASNSVNCWGRNISGQLGTGDFVNRSAASLTDISFLGTTQVSAVAAGEAHTCARVTALGQEQMRCWGANGAGQLGTTGSVQNVPPASVLDPNGVALAGIVPSLHLAAVGYHNCVVTTAGAAKCWGANQAGQLGIGLQGAGSSTAQAVSGLGSGVSAIATGGDVLLSTSFSCAVVGGGVQCWGSNPYGELGTGSHSSTPSLIPVQVSGLATGAGVTEIAAGGDHACAVVGSGARCWGTNFSGEIGSSSVAIGSQSDSPVPVTGLNSGVSKISCGTQFSCALTTAGTLLCWGDNGSGQLGDNKTIASGGGMSATPVAVVNAADVAVTGASAIAAGFRFACAIINNGAQCWGLNDFGQLGSASNPVESLVPIPVTGLGSSVTAIAAGQFHACAVVNGGVQCWGDNRYGQLGNNVFYQTITPTPVSGLGSGVVAIGAGRRHTCAVLGNGSIKCWGDDVAGEVGDGRILYDANPVTVLVGDNIFQNRFELNLAF